jgi:hypothetical protein
MSHVRPIVNPQKPNVSLAYFLTSTTPAAERMMGILKNIHSTVAEAPPTGARERLSSGKSKS